MVRAMKTKKMWWLPRTFRSFMVRAMNFLRPNDGIMNCLRPIVSSFYHKLFMICSGYLRCSAAPRWPPLMFSGPTIASRNVWRLCNGFHELSTAPWFLPWTFDGFAMAARNVWRPRGRYQERMVALVATARNVWRPRGGRLECLMTLWFAAMNFLQLRNSHHKLPATLQWSLWTFDRPTMALTNL
jgi:hypothetical protein